VMALHQPGLIFRKICRQAEEDPADLRKIRPDFFGRVFGEGSAGIQGATPRPQNRSAPLRPLYDGRDSVQIHGRIPHCELYCPRVLATCSSTPACASRSWLGALPAHLPTPSADSDRCPATSSWLAPVASRASFG